MESTIRRRVLRTQEPISSQQFASISGSLNELNGIVDVNLRSDDCLELEYDLLKINLLKIEKQLDEFEISLSKGFGQKFKRGWINFIEENEAKNLRSVAPDCCTPKKSK